MPPVLPISELKETLHHLPHNRFVAAWRAIERINTLLDEVGTDALLVVAYCKESRQARIAAAAGFPTRAPEGVE